MRAVNPESPVSDGDGKPPRRPRDLAGAGGEWSIDPQKLYRVDHAIRILGISKATFCRWTSDTERPPIPVLGPGTSAGFVMGHEIIDYFHRAPRHTKSSRTLAHKLRAKRRRDGSKKTE